MNTVKNIKNICMLSLAFACALPITAAEQPALKSATPEEIASCGTKLALIEALARLSEVLVPLASGLATALASKATYQTLSWFPKPVAFSCALFNGLVAFPVPMCANYFVGRLYMENKYDERFDWESWERIWKNAQEKKWKVDAALLVALLTGLVALSVQE